MKYNLKIRGTIGDWWSGTSADDVVRFLNSNKDTQIDVAICSPGGYVNDGLEIYQAFIDHGNVHAHIIGLTASMATVIAMGCKTVDMVSGSLILIHNASTLVSEYSSYNKEQLGELIDKYKKCKDDLNTFDDLIASIYSKKNGKCLKDNLDKMKKSCWLNAQEALDFGLIDSIRDDDEDKKLNDKIKNQFTNSITFKDYGFPAIPASTDIKSVADENGNPTDSFIAKTWQKLLNQVHKQHAEKSTNLMEIFKLMAACLAVTALNFTDDKMSLTKEQAQKIEDHLKELEDKITAADVAKAKAESDLTAANDSLAKAQQNLKEKEDEIKNLKEAPGDQSQSHLGENGGEANISEARKLFNLVNGKED